MFNKIEKKNFSAIILYYNQNIIAYFIKDGFYIELVLSVFIY